MQSTCFQYYFQYRWSSWQLKSFLSRIVPVAGDTRDSGSHCDTIFFKFTNDGDHFITFRWRLSLYPFVFTFSDDQWFHFHIILAKFFKFHAGNEREFSVFQSCFRLHMVSVTFFRDLENRCNRHGELMASSRRDERAFSWDQRSRWSELCHSIEQGHEMKDGREEEKAFNECVIRQVAEMGDKKGCQMLLYHWWRRGTQWTREWHTFRLRKLRPRATKNGSKFSVLVSLNFPIVRSVIFASYWEGLMQRVRTRTERRRRGREEKSEWVSSERRANEQQQWEKKWEEEEERMPVGNRLFGGQRKSMVEGGMVYPLATRHSQGNDNSDPLMPTSTVMERIFQTCCCWM